MPEGLKKNLPGSPRDGETQASFIDECWRLASPSGFGTHQDAGTQPALATPLRPCVPLRPRTGQGRNSADATGLSGERPCVPGEPDAKGNWADDARKLLATCPDANLRSDLLDHFEETASTLEHDQGNPRQVAEMLAFGDLLVEILRRGIDARVVANT